MSLFDFLFRPNIDKFQRTKNLKGILKAISYKESSIRLHAVATLMDFKEQGVIEALISCLKDYDWKVRDKAVSVLENIQHPEKITLLLDVLQDRNFDFRMRYQLATALAKQNDKRIAPALKKLETEKVLSKWRALTSYVETSKNPESILQRVGYFDAANPTFLPKGSGMFEIEEQQELKVGIMAQQIAQDRPDTEADLLRTGDALRRAQMINEANIRYYHSILQKLLSIPEVTSFIGRTTIFPLMQRLGGGEIPKQLLPQPVFDEISINAIHKLVDEKIKFNSTQNLINEVKRFILNTKTDEKLQEKKCSFCGKFVGADKQVAALNECTVNDLQAKNPGMEVDHSAVAIDPAGIRRWVMCLQCCSKYGVS